MAGNSIYEQFLKSAAAYPVNVALADYDEGSYSTKTYDDVRAMVEKIASALSTRISRGDHIALLLDNGSDWVCIDLAAAYLGCVIVPIHANYNAQYISKIIEHSESRFVFVHDMYLRTLSKFSGLSGVDTVFVVPKENLTHELPAKAMFLSELLVSSASGMPIRPADVDENDIHSIVYTSGTTGEPKGVMLTHRNFISNALAATARIPIYPTDRFFSFLPLSHVLERTAGYYVPLFSGAAVYYSRSPKTIVEDIAVAQPTMLVCVPRIFERIHEKIIDKFSHHKLLHRLFKRAIHLSGARKLHRRLSLYERLELRAFQFLIYKKVRRAFGGNLRLAISGGAPLYPHIGGFFESLGVLVLEGYGLTETSPIISVNTKEKYRFGTVGMAVDGVEVKLAGNSEILVRGNGLMKGYYKNSELTREVIDRDGWFHTGDLGSFGNDGMLLVVGRIKEMIVLSNGRNVYPVPIEQALEESKYIKQALIYSSKERGIYALIVIDYDNIKMWCDGNSVEIMSKAQQFHSRVYDLIKSEVEQKLTRFQKYEEVRGFKIILEPFSVENDLITPTLKLKRSKILSKYVPHK